MLINAFMTICGHTDSTPATFETPVNQPSKTPVNQPGKTPQQSTTLPQDKPSAAPGSAGQLEYVVIIRHDSHNILNSNNNYAFVQACDGARLKIS